MAPLVYNYTYVHNMLALSSLQHLCGYVYIIIWVNPKALEVYSFYLYPFTISMRLIVITNRKTSYCDNRENIMINDIRENIAINDIDH